MTRKHYSKEFRPQAAQLVVEQGYSCTEVSKRLGPSAWSVREWVAKYRKTGEKFIHHYAVMENAWKTKTF